MKKKGAMCKKVGAKNKRGQTLIQKTKAEGSWFPREEEESEKKKGVGDEGGALTCRAGGSIRRKSPEKKKTHRTRKNTAEGNVRYLRRGRSGNDLEQPPSGENGNKNCGLSTNNLRRKTGIKTRLGGEEGGGKRGSLRG